MKPEDIPQEVWDIAFEAMPPINREAYDRSPYAMVLHLGFAKAIMAAEKREREACALIGDTLGVLGGVTPNPYADWKGHADNIAAAIRNRGKP